MVVLLVYRRSGHQPRRRDRRGRLLPSCLKNSEMQATSAEATRRYTHDAWGRLVKVETKNTTGGSYYTSAEYAYNGLHWRTSKGVDYFGGGTIDRRVRYWYDASWRIVQEDHADIIDDDPLDGVCGVHFWDRAKGPVN